MVSLASVSANIKVIGRDGSRRKLHSHTMAFINAPGPALTYLPQAIKKEDFQVVFSNATAEDIDFAKKKFIRVRREQVDQRHNIALRFSKRAHKHKAQSPQFTCQYVLILLRRSMPIWFFCPPPQWGDWI